LTFKLPDTDLREWQVQALSAWSGKQRGIIAAATGTGKTLLAVHAVNRFWDERSRVIVVVPKQVLQDQWVRMFRTTIGLGPQILGTIGGPNGSFDLRHRVVVAVIDSARVRLPGIVEHWRSLGERVMLVVDECHWAGSVTSLSLLSTDFDATLGLSATPERSDDGFDELLVPRLGEVVYRYPLRRALDDGLLAPLEVVNLYFDLEAAEQREYARISDRISSLRARLMAGGMEDGPGWDARLAQSAAGDSDAYALRGLLQRRRRLTTSAAGRMQCLKFVVENGYLDHRRTLIFNESIAQAELVGTMLGKAGVSYELEHSQLTSVRRSAALRRFSTGSTPVLVAVRALDEGIDVPDADQGIIVSGTFNSRQRIQRIGRVVRRSGSTARVLSFLASGTAEQWEVGAADPQLLGPDRVSEVNLP